MSDMRLVIRIVKGVAPHTGTLISEKAKIRYANARQITININIFLILLFFILLRGTVVYGALVLDIHNHIIALIEILRERNARANV